MMNLRLNAINQVKEIYDYFSSLRKFSLLIPEVRTNISVAIKEARSVEDIAAIEGRITVIGGYPKAVGDIKFGVSDHTARLILTAKEFDKSINVVMNLKFHPELTKGISENTNLELREIRRDEQPEKVKNREHSTMQWLIKNTVNELGRVPDIIWDTGAKGKEPMMRIFSKSAGDMIKKLEKILKLI
ncbi:MAG: thiamine-phosphate synthase family protein [Promethearchaeati archaeon]